MRNIFFVDGIFKRKRRIVYKGISGYLLWKYVIEIVLLFIYMVNGLWIYSEKFL